jgi:hypothetical protein
LAPGFLKTVFFGRVFATLSLVAALAGLSILGLWGGLGKERGYVRLPVLVILAGLVGLAIGVGDTFQFFGDRVMVPDRWFLEEWPTLWWQWQAIMEGLECWMSWAVLAVTFLAGMLGMFRAAGYRLVRRPPLEPDQSEE